MSALNKRKLLDENISKLLQKFTIKEFRDHVLTVFEDVTWDAVKEVILRYNLSSRMRDIAKIILEYTSTFNNQDLQQTYHNLLLLDLNLHNTKKLWTAVTMKQEEKVIQDTDFEKNIIKEFQKNSIKMSVYSKLADDRAIRWLILVVNKKTRNRGVIQQRPIYIARAVNEPFIFYSPKSVSSDKLKILISGFGFIDFKINKLSGKDVPSLISMLKRHKVADQLRARNALVLNNDVVDCVRSSRGIDFCQNEVRSAHARQIFGDEPIKLESLIVNAKTEWRGLRTLPEFEGNEFNVSIRIRSKDVRKTLQEFMESGVIKSPYPEWIKEFFISGKNIINIG